MELMKKNKSGKWWELQIPSRQIVGIEDRKQPLY